MNDEYTRDRFHKKGKREIHLIDDTWPAPEGGMTDDMEDRNGKTWFFSRAGRSSDYAVWMETEAFLSLLYDLFRMSLGDGMDGW